jgi:tetratricopeptide (TPR) repeat protein
MYFRSTLVALLLFLIPFQSANDSFQKNFEAAEALRRAGNLAGAEAQFREILAEAYYRLGRVQIAQGNYLKAAETLETAATSRPQSADVLVDLGVAFFYLEQYQKAIVLLGKALSLEPNNARAHSLLGKTYFQVGEFQKADDELKTTLRLTPKDYEVTYTLGLALLKRQQLAAAKQLYNEMVAQLGNRPQLRVLIGRAYRETGFLAEAIDEFKQAIALDPRLERVHYYLGITYLLKDGMTRLADARVEFEKELAGYPNEFFANYYLGITHIIEGQWRQAVAPLENASRALPNNPDPYFYLGQAYQSIGEFPQAIEALKKAIAYNPDLSHNDYQVTNAHFRLGQSLLKAGQTAEAEKELQIASDLKSKAFKSDEAKLGNFLHPANLNEQRKVPELISDTNLDDAKTRAALAGDEVIYTQVLAAAHNNIGLLRAEQEDFRAAAEQFSLAVKLNPRQEGLSYNLGLAYYRSASYKDAIGPLENELNDRPTNLPARQLLGLSYFMVENYPKASILLNEVVAAKPHDTSLYYPLALSLSKEGKTEAAAKVVQQMVASGEKSPQLHIVLSQIHYQQNDTEKALEELRTAVSLDNQVRLAHFYTGVIFLRMGKLVEATREFEVELTLSPHDVEAKYHLAYALLARQETERGIGLMREVIQAKPDFGNAHFELGKALLQKGDIKGAVESLEKAAALENGQAHVHYQLGRAYVAAGRQTEGEKQLEISRQLKDKALKDGNQ